MVTIHKSPLLRALAASCLVVIGTFLPGRSQADVLDGSGASFSVFVNLVYDGETVLVGPGHSVFGFAPDPYVKSSSELDVNFTSSLFSFTADDVWTFVQSDVDGTAGSKFSFAEIIASNVAIDIGSIISFKAANWYQETFAGGEADFFFATNIFSPSGTSLSINGTSVTLAAGTLFDEDGLFVSYRTSNVVEDPMFGSAVGVGLLVSFLNYDYEGKSLNGTVMFGYSQATVNAVPEPATMLALGVPALLMLRRRRNRG